MPLRKCENANMTCPQVGIFDVADRREDLGLCSQLVPHPAARSRLRGKDLPLRGGAVGIARAAAGLRRVDYHRHHHVRLHHVHSTIAFCSRGPDGCATTCWEVVEQETAYVRARASPRRAVEGQCRIPASARRRARARVPISNSLTNDTQEWDRDISSKLKLLAWMT